MSVVNDVLKNLNQRHAQEHMAGYIPNLYENKPTPQYFLWFLFFSILSASIVIAVFQWQQPNYIVQSIELPSDLFLLEEEKILYHNEPDQMLRENLSIKENIPSKLSLNKPSIEKPILGEVALDKAAEKKVIVHKTPVSKITEGIVKKPSPIKKSENSIVNRSAQSQAVDQVVQALKEGNHKAVQVDLDKTPKLIQDEIKLRLMVKESPESVLPYLKANFINFSNNSSLLAMAAQAQQRTHQHFSAISIYKQLISIQPKDARWRAGLAISLEASGEKKAAKYMYKLALSMSGLPVSLTEFSKKRLSILK
mgnify:CR=1 FL=1